MYEHAIEFVRMDNQKKYQFKLSSAEEKEGWLRDVDMVTAELLGITRDSYVLACAMLPPRRGTVGGTE